MPKKTEPYSPAQLSWAFWAESEGKLPEGTARKWARRARRGKAAMPWKEYLATLPRPKRNPNPNGHSWYKDLSAKEKTELEKMATKKKKTSKRKTAKKSNPKKKKSKRKASRSGIVLRELVDAGGMKAYNVNFKGANIGSVIAKNKTDAMKKAKTKIRKAIR